MKGIYLLLISIRKNIKQEIGALGRIAFVKGHYVYAGSAQNSVEKRVARHLSDDKKIRWHIDYLLSNPYVKVEKVFVKEAGKEEECRTARKFKQGVKGFGCSDCSCESHLFRVENWKGISGFREYLL